MYPTLFVAQVCIVLTLACSPCQNHDNVHATTYQPTHWPVQPCPNHYNLRAANPSIGQCIHAQTMTTSMLQTHPSKLPATNPCIGQRIHAQTMTTSMQRIHWPVHPCPNHDNVRAANPSFPLHPCPNHDDVHATSPSIGQCIRARTLITSAQLFRRTGLFVCGVKEHIVQNLASSLQPLLVLQFPVTINK